MGTVPQHVKLPHVMARIAELGPAGLEAVDRLLNRLELDSIAEDVQADMDQQFPAGEPDQRHLHQAIEEHRNRQPYR